MTITETSRDGVVVLSLTGELTIGKGDVELRDTCKAVLERGVRKIVLDFTHVRYMDSAGLGELIACNKRARERGGSIRLVLNAKTREILVVGAVLRVFEVFDDVASAAAGF